MGTDMSSIQTAYQGFAKQNYTMLDNLNAMGALAA
jgi:phage-related protein